jgi:hypothetical protein
VSDPFFCIFVYLEEKNRSGEVEYCENSIDQIQDEDMESLIARELQNYGESNGATGEVRERVI